MKIKQDPISKLWCREDGAILMPPCRRIHRFKYTWTFGSKHPTGYRIVCSRGKPYKAHQAICRAFHGLPPKGKPFVDHINRIRDDNRPDNLHWASVKENNDNAGHVDQSIEKYGVRHCEDEKSYHRAYYESHREGYIARSTAYWKTHSAAYRAEKKAQGLTMRKGPDGK